ncbi:siderophore-interacting protein [Pseudomonas violetae]|uniref:Siderophore-interacting protein n=1 Tax=Pseudomonas violetae TaxID=2915813 RepID=A0ABT0ESZ7_9PSED|nr:siderophore-interacting protein [Pseudomonas violetae]MCK1788851.1 siderophore-interacting protein [Pseudomonas violetae]
MLEELGVNPEHHFTFARLMKSIRDLNPNFELLGPASPYVSRNELELLGALGAFSRKKNQKQGKIAPAPPDAIATLFGSCGMALRIGGVIMRSRPSPVSTSLPGMEVPAGPLHYHPRLRPAKVVEVLEVTPRLRRIVVTGVSLFDFPEGRPGQWVKLFLEAGNGGVPVGRAYSILEWDAQRRRMTFDIAIHCGGPMSQWAANARIGDRLSLSGPRGGLAENNPRSWLLLAGDESALAAIQAIMAQTIPEKELHVFIEVSTERDIIEIPELPNAEIRWVLRDSEHPEVYSTLYEAIRCSPLPNQPGAAWVAGESGAVKKIRQHLLRERGFNAENLQAAGFWKKGEVDFKDLAVG